MRLISSTLLTILAFYGAWWLWHNNPQVQEVVWRFSGKEAVLTLEVRYSEDDIMSANRKELFVTPDHTYLDSELHFYPFLMMEVKYASSSADSSEGILIWGLEDGEMVLDTDSWQVTHGFEDCIACDANAQDFQLLRLLSERGSATADELAESLDLDLGVTTARLNAARRKHLLLEQNGRWRLHFKEPHFNVEPNTRISQWLVTKPVSDATVIPKRYSPRQIHSLARAAFGSDFVVRSQREVFLPVYSIRVSNPDGSILTSYWNALNGQRVHLSAMLND